MACASSFLFNAGQLEITCSAGEDVVVFDQMTPGGIHLTLNEHQSEFSAGDVRGITIRGLQVNDIILLDRSMSLPVRVEGTLGNQAIGGWVSDMLRFGMDAARDTDYFLITAESLSAGQISADSPAGIGSTHDDMMRSLVTSAITAHSSVHAAGANVLIAPTGDRLAAWHESSLDGEHESRPAAALAHAETRGVGTVPTYKVHKPG